MIFFEQQKQMQFKKHEDLRNCFLSMGEVILCQVTRKLQFSGHNKLMIINLWKTRCLIRCENKILLIQSFSDLVMQMKWNQVWSRSINFNWKLNLKVEKDKLKNLSLICRRNKQEICLLKSLKNKMLTYRLFRKYMRQWIKV